MSWFKSVRDASRRSCQALPKLPTRIELLVCDIDPEMAPMLERTVAELHALCRRHRVAFEGQAKTHDFLLSPLACSALPAVDAVIANPPYFKVARQDPRVLAHERAVDGQPNIYALFMAACAALLRPGGAFGFITPRSWTNGAYFRALRRFLRERLSIDALHLFDSRQAHFEADAVLQEALITWGTAGGEQGTVDVSVSHGVADLDAAVRSSWPASAVLGAAIDAPICLPTPGSAAASLGTAWPLRLADLGLRVATGPVVGFRATEYLRGLPAAGTVPMLWMPHVQRSSVMWPRGHKAEHIECSEGSKWMLLPNEPVVLLRRFSPKEDERRVTAAAYEGGLPGERLGFENHLNVIRGLEQSLTVLAARGLAGWLNSEPVDDYLRQRLGSTQINAVELRSLPLPDLVTLEDLGKQLSGRATLAEIDTRVQALVERANRERPAKRARAA